MVARDALRQAITDLERLTDDPGAANQRPAASVLARLYTTYAQATLEAHGISIDLPSLCGDNLMNDAANDSAYYN
jgi:hypothetical protein